MLFAGVIFLLWGGFPPPVAGHLPAGQVYRAFQFPDHMIPVVDGRLDDWEEIDDSYAISTERFHDLVKGEEAVISPGDFSVRLMVGWNEAQNRLFVAARVVDDLHQIDRAPGTATTQIFMDDDMEVFVDADHSGGQYADFRELSEEEQRLRNGTEANHFVLAGPPPDGDFFVNFSAASWYALADGPYTAAACRIEEGTTGGAAVVDYEMMLVPFDRLDVNAVFLSDEHDLRENEIIGFNVVFNDFDLRSSLFDARWSLSGGYNAPVFSERFTDLMLMPSEYIFHTEVEAATWGRIKASFAPLRR